ncbi:MAG: hypothetical protein WBA10_10650 [Elainellaceae cyanobacterium]
MRIDPMIAITFIFLSLMAGATAVSGVRGYTLGRSALRGITQPDMRPARVEEASGDRVQRTKMVFIKEEAILDDLAARMNGSPTTPQ